MTATRELWVSQDPRENEEKEAILVREERTENLVCVDHLGFPERMVKLDPRASMDNPAKRVNVEHLDLRVQQVSRVHLAW
jgi:hypothetical protein